MAEKVRDRSERVSIYKKLLAIIFGNLLCALAFNIFFIPSKLLSGGAGGLAIMIQYLTNIPSGIAIFAINVPIFVIGYKMIDKNFAIYSFISMFILSFLLTITNGIDAYFPLNDIFLAAIFGGILNGTGMGIMFRNRTSQGGLDIIAAILKRKYNINIGTGLMMVNTVIIALAGIRLGAASAMYTLVALYIAYQILDKVQTGFNVRKNVIIVSNNSEKIANGIISKLGRGVTFLEGIGAYTKENRQVIYCIVTSNEIVKLKGIVDKIDPEALLTINDVVEVKGPGFKEVGM